MTTPQVAIGASKSMQGTFTANDAPSDPTDVYGSLTDPDGNVTTYEYGTDPEVTRSGVGVYVFTFNMPLEGVYIWRLYSTGTSGTAAQGQFETVDLATPEADPTINLAELANAPKRTRTEEGTVEERTVDELIKADQYLAAKTEAQTVPWGIRTARVRPGGPGGVCVLVALALSLLATEAGAQGSIDIPRLPLPQQSQPYQLRRIVGPAKLLPWNWGNVYRVRVRPPQVQIVPVQPQGLPPQPQGEWKWVPTQTTESMQPPLMRGEWEHTAYRPVVPDLPTLANSAINTKLHQARVYELPRIYWFQGAFRDATYDIGPVEEGKTHNNGLRDFPWAKPAGRLQDHTIKLVWPPDVRSTPVIALHRTISSVSNGRPRYARVRKPSWKHPVGICLFEVHMHPKGHPFEVRMLEKVTDGYGFDNYEARVFQPYEYEEDLPVRVRGVAHKVSMYSRHPYNRFEASGVVWAYPDVAVNWKEHVMARQWVNVTDGRWHQTATGHGWLVPKEYFGWVTGGDDGRIGFDACAKCHGNAGDHTSFFEPFRDWYGHIGGGDGTFTFDPIDRRTVMYGVNSGAPVNTPFYQYTNN